MVYFVNKIITIPLYWLMSLIVHGHGMTWHIGQQCDLIYFSKYFQCLLDISALIIIVTILLCYQTWQTVGMWRTDLVGNTWADLSLDFSISIHSNSTISCY